VVPTFSQRREGVGANGLQKVGTLVRERVFAVEDTFVGARVGGG
jgi:hypothetical protein